MSVKKQKRLVASKQMLPRFTDAELEKFAASVGLTVSQLKEYGEAAYRTYQSIGGDLTEAMGGKTVSRYALVECCLDANHVDVYGRLPKTFDWKKWRKERTYDYLDLYDAVAAVAFPYPRYE